MRGIRVWLALLACAPLVAACSGGPLVARRGTPGACDAPDAAVENYLYGVVARAINAMDPGILHRHQQVTVSFVLAADGSATDIRVIHASTPAAASEGARAVRAASPYRPPPFSPSACLIGARAQVTLFSSGRCDSSRADPYIDAVSAAIAKALLAPGFAGAPGAGRVTLRIKAGAEGGALASVSVHDAESAEAGAKALAAARELSPLPPPGESIRECVADQPFFVWLEVPGL
jgi:outer membrane biosynthesis protein TonB